MGGRAFTNVELSRINREDIDSTLRFISESLSFEGLNVDYMKSNLMGSVGKQADSGDIDIIMDSNCYDKKVLYRLADHCCNVLGYEMVRSQGLKAGQLNTAFPIAGDPNKGFIQVDFIYGDADWLRFSHWSPGKDRSPFKGVFISQAIGVLAKMAVLYTYPENAVVDKDNDVDERLAEVAYAYDLENGLRLRARLRRKGGFGEVEFDTFETYAPVMPPRVPRIGYITDPNTVLEKVIAPGVKQSDVETFEDFLVVVKNNFSQKKWDQFKERLTSSIMRSAAKREITEQEFKDLLDSV